LPLKIKNVIKNDKINCKAKMNSSIGMLVFSSIIVHLLEIPSIARSWGMLVNSNITSKDIKKKNFVISYIRNILEITASLINKSNLKVDFKSLNKINKFVRVHKDQTEHTHKKNVVYKIHCKDCDVSYVGQTKRQLRTRVKEHRDNIIELNDNIIKLNESKHSVIPEHMLSCNHSFHRDKVKILDTELNYNKRLILEMLHIKEQFNSINSQKNTEFLDDAYFCLLDNLSNHH